MNNSRYVTALDIGSSKVAAIVGEKTAAGIKIIGYSEVPSDGVTRGEIIKIQKVAAAAGTALGNVREQIQAVTDTDGYRIRKVYVNISGPNIRCVQGSIHRDRPDPLAAIDKEEIGSMLEEMYGMKVEPSEQVLYVAPQYYDVDDHMGEPDPEYMDGKSIDGEYKVFVGRSVSVARCKAVIDKLNLSAGNLILTPMASGAALLTDEERELGSVLVDIGAGTTDVVIYHGDILRYAAVIPFGGNSVSEDISQTCSISMRNAEQLKIQRGMCISEFSKENTIIIKEGGMTVKDVPAKLLSQAVEARVCEILATVRHIIEVSGFKNKLHSRAVLTGGSANLNLIQLLAKNILGMDVRTGQPDSSIITGNSVEQVFRPQASTAVGLVIEAFRQQDSSEEEDSIPEETWTGSTDDRTDSDGEPSLFTKEETGPVTQPAKSHEQRERGDGSGKNKKVGIKNILQTLFPTTEEDGEA